MLSSHDRGVDGGRIGQMALYRLGVLKSSKSLVGLSWWLRGKESTCPCRRHSFPSMDWEDPVEKEMAAHSSILAWEIPRTEESGGLQSIGSQRVGHN